MVIERDWQSSAQGFESHWGHFKTFFNFLYPTWFCQCFSEETLPFLRCAIIGNVQFNWPKLFQDFSVMFTVIFSYMRSFNPKPLQLESWNSHIGNDNTRFKINFTVLFINFIQTIQPISAGPNPHPDTCLPRERSVAMTTSSRSRPINLQARCERS